MRDILNDLESGMLSDPDPIKRAQRQMRQPLPKRFYGHASVAPVEGGYTVHLDGRPIRTPGRAVVTLASEPAARLVADEFECQKDEIDPVTMPVTRLVNTTIDGVANQPDAVLEDILRYASSDLLCYRAAGPDRLVALQSEAWDPILDWARNTLGARLFLAEGVIQVEQPRESIAALGVHLRLATEPFRLASLHVMTTLTGSALLALAVDAGELDVETAWRAAHVDEDWTIAQWGEDAEAAAARQNRYRDMVAAYTLLGPSPDLNLRQFLLRHLREASAAATRHQASRWKIRIASGRRVGGSAGEEGIGDQTARHQMHHLEAARLQVGKEPGQHGNGSGMDIVEEHDA